MIKEEKNMNSEKKFLIPEAEIVEFPIEDVIFTSGEADYYEIGDSQIP